MKEYTTFQTGRFGCVWRGLLILSSAFFGSQLVSVSAETEMRRFDVPGGKATAALRKAARQADVDFMFSTKDVRGVRTRSVYGEFIPIEAFNLMLADTSLAVFQHEKSGVYAIRSEAPNMVSSNSEKTTPMNENKQDLGKLLKSLLALGIAGSSNLAGQEDSASDDEIFELSPFTVEASEDNGYRATTTLAGSRIRSNLGDLGSAISVLTKEFMEDLGANEAETLLPNALNIEIGGVQGNFSADREGTGGQNQVRTNPQNEQRVRGLDAATLTRNYFLTSIPFDSYNTDRITINRGPNSLLFGIGSPGGIIDNSLIKASISKNFGEVGFRIGERGSTRFNFNVNRVLVEDRLAIRVAGLQEKTEFQQRPAFEDDERLYFAAEAVLRQGEDNEFFGRTVARANVEVGEIVSNRPNVVPMLDLMSGWWNAPDPSLDGQWGIALNPDYASGAWRPRQTVDAENRLAHRFRNAPGTQSIPFWVQAALVGDAGAGSFGGAVSGTNIQGIMGGWGFGGSGTPRHDFLASSIFNDQYEGSSAARLYKVPTVPYNVFDNENLLLSGNTNEVVQDFDAWNITLEQVLFDGKGGIEISYDEQNYDTVSSLAFGGNGGGDRNVLQIDVNEILPSGSPNPNVGRPLISADQVRSKSRDNNRNEALRATAFYELDLSERADGWLGNLLGRHIVTGFYSDQTIEDNGLDTKFVWAENAAHDLTFNFGGPLGSWRRNVNSLVYVGPSFLGSQYSSYDDVRITEVINAPQLNNGDEFVLQFYDRELALSTPETDAPASVANVAVQEVFSGGSISRQEITSEVLSLQSFFFGGNLVGLLGWRDDESTKFERIPSGNGVSYNLPDLTLDLNTVVLDPVPALVASGESITKSLVGHLPADWNPLSDHVKVSAHWSESENFQPTSARRNILGETISPPTGVTEEYGITFGLLQNRMMVRLNWYETSAEARSLNTGGNIFLTSGEGGRWLEARRNGIPFRSIGNPGDPDYVQGAYDWALQNYQNPEAIADGAIDLNYQTYDQFLQALFDTTPEPTRSVVNHRIENDRVVRTPILGMTATSEAIAEGFEIDIVGNITPNWRLSLNIGKQETVTSNSAALFSQVADQITQNMRDSGIFWLGLAPNLNLTGMPGDPPAIIQPGAGAFGPNYLRNTVSSIAAARAKDGTVSQEQRKWRANLATNYSFDSDGLLKGFEIGGALRYQDEVAVGYEQLDLDGDGVFLPNVDDPIFGPSETRGDIWLRYRRMLRNNKVDWTVQLNMRNVIGDNDPIPIWANPDRTFARFRNPPTRDVFLSNTFKF